MPIQEFILPKDIPLDQYPQPETFLSEARRLIEEAQKQGIAIRVMGPIALHFYFPDYVDLYRRMERLAERVFTDIDYAAYGKQRSSIVRFFQAQGYDFHKDTMMYFGQDRHIYFPLEGVSPTGSTVPMIDVFYDKLDMNHCVDYRGRLESHPLCVSLSDLLLQKLQIVQINDKDMKDAMLLLLAGDLGSSDEGTINVSFLARRMSDDWGFYHTSTTNLERIKSHMVNVRVLTDEQRKVIAGKVDTILAAMEKQPKSLGWKVRARAGTKRTWYREVSDWD